MTRVKRGIQVKKRHRKILRQAKGYWGGNRRLIRSAKEAVSHAMKYAYMHRRTRKREMRTLWIARISAAVKPHGVNYSRFMYGLNAAGIALDRKQLSEMAIHDPAAFARIVEQAKASASG
jgi:large subunit ribosomal protein L20